MFCERRTPLPLNQRVHGSSPCAPTIKINDLSSNLNIKSELKTSSGQRLGQHLRNFAVKTKNGFRGRRCERHLLSVEPNTSAEKSVSGNCRNERTGGLSAQSAARAGGRVRRLRHQHGHAISRWPLIPHQRSPNAQRQTLKAVLIFRSMHLAGL